MQNLDKIILQLTNEQAKPDYTAIKESDVIDVVSAVRKVLLSEPSCLSLQAPVMVVGDIHGQFGSLLNVTKQVADRQLLFLGDYVNNGPDSLSCILLLLCYKLKYPANVHMIRGNHECGDMCKVYGSTEQVKAHYSEAVVNALNELYDALPLAATVNEKIFCVHGGLGPELQTLEQIRQIVRPVQVPQSGLLCNMLWSDPDALVDDFHENPRGAGVMFGKSQVEAFLKANSLSTIVRGHQLEEQGYKEQMDGQVVTLFSAPNYRQQQKNVGAVMLIDKDMQITYKTLEAQLL